MEAQVFVNVRQTGGRPPAAGNQRVDIRLSAEGMSLHACAEAPRGPARLADMVPLAQKLGSEMNRLLLGKLQSEGNTVPCRKGCQACCRYLVPISAPEALRLWEQLSVMPPSQRRRLLSSCVAASRRVLDAGPLPAADRPANAPTAASQLSRWYSSLHLDCPFLRRGACEIYSNRPLACREHFATGASRQCLAGQLDHQAPIAPPFSVAEALSQLAVEFEPAWPAAIILPLAPAWVQNAGPQQSFPAPVLLGRLLEILQRQIDDRAKGSKNTSVAA